MRLFGLLIFGAAAIWAQGGSMGFTPPTVKPGGVMGAPFSGEEQWLRGESVTKGRKIFRDSDGRMRTERAMAPGSKHYIVEISDPVLGAYWVLDMQHKVAHLMMPQPAPPAPEPMPATLSNGLAATAQTQQPVTTVEAMEPIEIDGVKVVGNRSTTIFADGRKVVGETWMSPDLQIILKSQMGDDIFQMAGLSRKEPYPSLFRVPADYTVIEEKTTFVVQYQ
jgi:hypothetical protein